MNQSIDVTEAKKLVGGVWGQQLIQVAFDCVAPFFWMEPQQNHMFTVNNGTIFFLDTGVNKFAVTAYHVYQGYLDSIGRNKKTICNIHTERFVAENNIIDHSDTLDLITFRVNEKFVSKIGKRYFAGHQKEWPPQPPEEDKGVFFVGFPGKDRVIVEKTIEWGAFGGLCVAHSISHDNVTVQHESKYAVDMPGIVSAPIEYNLAGISGAPLITLVQSNDTGMNYWRLGGIIYESPSGLGLFYARRSDFILANGEIKK